MRAGRVELLAGMLVVATGSLWGLYWVPVRQLAETAMPGAWSSLGVAVVACLFLVPFAIRGRRRLATARPLALATVALGGASFMLYSVGLVYGRVAIVILLFYLTPVWSTLIARLWLGWTTPWLRYAAIAAGFSGFALVLSADGGLPLPRGIGDWLGLASGVLWAVASTGIRMQARMESGETTFVFALGALAAAVVLAPVLAPLPGLPPRNAWAPAIFWLLTGGGLWWGLSMAGLLWAAARLEPARVGILLMSEVLVGIFSAALFAGETLQAVEIAGGVLMAGAAVLEVWPVRAARNRSARATSRYSP